MADLLDTNLTAQTPAETPGTPTGLESKPEGSDLIDPVKNAAEVFYGDDKGGKPSDEKSGEESAEDKAAREAKEASETPEEKAAREAEEAKAKEAEADERYGAPEGDYETFTFPEGVEVDEAGVADVVGVSKELNLSQASAQKFIDAAVAMRARDAERLETVHNGWIAAAETDKEYGGTKLKESLAVAQKALKEFGSPELGELLAGARLGNHPEVIRLLVRVGNRISEAPIINGGKPVEVDAAKTLYPNLK